MKRIDDKLSVFFSAKANVIEDEFENYNKSIIEELRLVALLSKGGHSLSRVENRLNILAYYVNHPYEKNCPSGIPLMEN